MTTRTIAGNEINFNDDGFMLNPAQWSRDVAETLAAEIKVGPLTERHWAVIEFCRADFEARGESPSLRRIKKAGGIPTKELYKLFPKGPAKKVAYVSGLGKPEGCI